jgi:hypothetical protein
MRGFLVGVYRQLGRKGRLRTVAEIVGAIVLLSGGAALGSVAATSSATPSTVHGCVNIRTGALSVELKAGARCPRRTRSLTWTAGPSAFGAKTNQATVSASSGNTCTLGQAILMPGKVIPQGTVLANGQLLSIGTNTALFSLYGTRYGGNGTSTFGVPNLKSAAPNGLAYAICVSGVFP